MPTCRILLVFTVTLLSLCSVAQGSLILDGGFEESQLGQPPAWPWDTQAGRRLTVVDDQTGPVYEGHQAVLLTEGPGGAQGGGSGNLLRQTLTGLTAGSAYSVSAWINITDFESRKSSDGVRLLLMDDWEALATASTGPGVTDGWVQLHTSAYAPAIGELTVQVDEYGKHTLNAFIDHITISPAPIPEPQAFVYVALAGLLLLVRRPGSAPGT